MSLLSKALNLTSRALHDRLDALSNPRSEARAQQRDNQEALEALDAALVELRVNLEIATSRAAKIQDEISQWEVTAASNHQASFTSEDEADKKNFERKAGLCLEKIDALEPTLASAKALVEKLTSESTSTEEQLKKAKAHVNTAIQNNDLLQIEASAAEATSKAADALAKANFGTNTELADKIELENITAKARINAVDTPEDFSVPTVKPRASERLAQLVDKHLG